MNTKTIKTIIIALLFAANLFFMLSIFSLGRDASTIPRNMAEDAATILESRGIRAETNKIPLVKPWELIYEGVYPGGELYQKIIAAFYPESTGEESQSGYIMPNGGLSMTAGKFKFLFGTDGDLAVSVIREGEHELVAAEIYEKIEEVKKIGTVGVRDSEVNLAASVFGDFLTALGGGSKNVSFDVIGFNRRGDTEIEAVVRQNIDKIALGENCLYIRVTDGQITYLAGKWYFGELLASFTMPLLDSVNILFKCADKDFTPGGSEDTLSAMSHEYAVMRQNAERFYLIPSWRIEFESGSSYLYNMVTGAR
ncbi:hypothetical protein FACS1894105_07100 [Clostridia bacterium]|nr:hypothetical protein FACS1894105_07100 [Clostridia bacterium]